MEKIKKFLKAEEGVTAIEYTLIAAGIGCSDRRYCFRHRDPTEYFLGEHKCLSRKVAVSQKLDDFFRDHRKLLIGADNRF